MAAFRWSLKHHLELKEWDQKVLARESGVSESVISRMPEGMTLWAAIAMSRAMGLTVGKLLKESSQTDGSQPRTVVIPFTRHPNVLLHLKREDAQNPERIGERMRVLQEPLRKAVVAVSLVHGYSLELASDVASTIYEEADEATRASLGIDEWFGRIAKGCAKVAERESGTFPSTRPLYAEQTPDGEESTHIRETKKGKARPKSKESARSRDE